MFRFVLKTKKITTTVCPYRRLTKWFMTSYTHCPQTTGTTLCEMCAIVGDETPACAHCPECGASLKCRVCYLKDAECIYRCHDVGYILRDGRLINGTHIHHPISHLRNILIPWTVTRPLGVFLSLPINNKSSLPPIEMMLLDFAHVPTEMEWTILRERLYRRTHSALLCYYGTCVAHWSDVRLFLAKAGSTRLYRLGLCTIHDAIVKKGEDGKYGCDYIHIVCMPFDTPCPSTPTRITHTQHVLFLVYIRIPHLDLFGFAPMSQRGVHMLFKLPERTREIRDNVSGVWRHVTAGISYVLYEVGLSSTYKMLAYNTKGIRRCITTEIMYSLKQTRRLICNHVMMIDIIDIYNGRTNNKPCALLVPQCLRSVTDYTVRVQNINVQQE